MANNYSEADKLAFKRKDLLNSKMSALKAASLINEGNSEVKVKQVLKEAQEYFDWLVQGQDFSDIRAEKKSKKSKSKEVVDKATENPTIPVPNLQQKKVLDIIQQKTGMIEAELFPLILEWSLTISGIENKTYPTKDSSVKLFMNWLKEKKK